MINSLSELKAYYRVNDIIASLEKNLETHKKEYAEAVTNWRKTVLATLENTFDEYTRKGKFDTFDTSPFTKLTKPVNCEDGYIKAINMYLDTKINMHYIPKMLSNLDNIRQQYHIKHVPEELSSYFPNLPPCNSNVLIFYPINGYEQNKHYQRKIERPG